MPKRTQARKQEDQARDEPGKKQASGGASVGSHTITQLVYDRQGTRLIHDGEHFPITGDTRVFWKTESTPFKIEMRPAVEGAIVYRPEGTKEFSAETYHPNPVSPQAEYDQGFRITETTVRKGISRIRIHAVTATLVITPDHASFGQKG